MMSDRDSLFTALRRAWSRSTSADPGGWAPDNPAWGQCAVTALVVQDILGGRLVRAAVNGMSHYYNLLDTGEQIDLTLEQFPAGSSLEDQAFREREYVLSFADTARRYQLLKETIAKTGVPTEVAVPA